MITRLPDIEAAAVAHIVWEPLVLTPIALALYAAVILGVVWLARRLRPLRTAQGRHALRRRMVRWRQQMRGRFRRSWVYDRILRHLSYEALVVALGFLVALVLWFLSLNWAAGRVPVDFFGAAAQINPVFIVAFAIELRMIDRLGMSENAFASAAGEALGDAVHATIAWENEAPEAAREFEAKVDSHRELRWVWHYAEQSMYDPESLDFSAIARARYRARRAGQAVFAIAVIVSVVGGQAAAVVGLSQDGAAPCSTIFRLTIATLGATTVMVVMGAMRDLLADVFARSRG